MEQKQTNGMAVASLVLGIVSAVCISSVTLLFYRHHHWHYRFDSGHHGEEEAALWHGHHGIVLSAVALGLCVITFIACFACTACALGSAGSFELSCLISTAVSSIVEEHMEKRGRFLLRFFFVPIPS